MMNTSSNHSQASPLQNKPVASTTAAAALRSTVNHSTKSPSVEQSLQSASTTLQSARSAPATGKDKSPSATSRPPATTETSAREDGSKPTPDTEVYEVIWADGKVKTGIFDIWVETFFDAQNNSATRNDNDQRIYARKQTEVDAIIEKLSKTDLKLRKCTLGDIRAGKYQLVKTTYNTGAKRYLIHRSDKG